MADPFDPADFDTPPSASSNPETDYRDLLDAMRKAGAEGVARQVATLSAKIEQDTAQRDQWLKQVKSGVHDLHVAANRLQLVSHGVSMDRLKEWISAALITIAILFAAAWIWRWAQEPQIEQHLYGCTTRWDAKTRTCKGNWVPLQAK